jgi:hypothetical protein
MVGTIKSRATRPLSKGEQGILLPGETAAEPWEMWVLGESRAECLGVYAQPVDNPASAATILALPVAQVFCLPLWLNETDPKQFAGMVPLQLEMRGIQLRNQEAAIFDLSIVAQEETRTLVLIGILPATLSQKIEVDGYQAFDLSVRYFPFSPDALTLWREQDGWVCAMTRGAHPAYFQALGEGPLSHRTGQDLACVLAALAMQGIVTSLREMVIRSEAGPAEISALEATLPLPVRFEEPPAPRAPGTPWKLVPGSVHRAKQARQSRRWRWRGIFLAAALYLCLVGTLIGHLFFVSSKVKELEAWQAQHAAAVAQVRETRASWKELLPVVDEKSYPLELLLHVSEAIPGDQLHLTLFEAEKGHLLIKGEAKNVAAAFQLIDQLKKSPAFAGYTWEMGQPHLLPNDLAQFQIEGDRGPEVLP